MAFPLRRAGGRSAECHGQRRRRQTTARPAPNSDADGPCLDRPAEKAQPPFRPSASHSEKRPTRVVKKTAAESSPSETETTFRSVRFRSSRGLAASSFVCLLLFFCANRKPPRHFSTGRALLCKTVGHCEGETIRKFFGQGKPTNLANPFWRNASEFMDKQRDAGTPKPISVSSPPSTDPIVQVKICSTKHENAIKMTIL